MLRQIVKEETKVLRVPNSRSFKSKLVLLFALILTIANFLFLNPTFGNEHTNSEKTNKLSIPVVLKPENGVFSFSLNGSTLNNLFTVESQSDKKIYIKPKSKEKIDNPNEEIKTTINETFIHAVIEEQGILIFINKGMELEIKIDNLNETNSVGGIFYVGTNEDEEFKGNFSKEKSYSLSISSSEIVCNLNLYPGSKPQKNNPIVLLNKRAPSCSVLEYKIKESAVETDGARIALIFYYKDGTDLEPIVKSIDVEKRKNEEGLWGAVNMPSSSDFNSISSGAKTLQSIFLITNKSGKYFLKSDDISVSSRIIGGLLGLIPLALLLIIVRWAKATPLANKKNIHLVENWDNLGPVERFLRFFLHFAYTPLSRYSISLAQISFWTIIVLFGLVYVAYTRGEFLSITEQMLILLGISGTTSVAAKVTSMSRVYDIPDEYLNRVRRDRIPKFKDLFCIGDVPNIFKFQIFAFTLFTGVMVLIELIGKGEFPVIQNNLLILMGISGGVYIANELATENVWKKIEGLIINIRKKKKDIFELDKTLAVINDEITKLDQLLRQVKASIAQREKLIGQSLPVDDPDKQRENKIQNLLDEKKAELAKVGEKNEIEEEVTKIEDEVVTILKGIYQEDPEQ